MMMVDAFNKSDYRTSDTPLATYLICEGYNLISIDYTEPRYTFVFDNSNGILEHAQKYITGRALVDPFTFQRITRKLARTIKQKQQWVEQV